MNMEQNKNVRELIDRVIRESDIEKILNKLSMEIKDPKRSEVYQVMIKDEYPSSHREKVILIRVLNQAVLKCEESSSYFDKTAVELVKHVNSINQ